ncbi:hypothetical protein GCM10009806_29400 [Microbacterium flavum]
MPLFFAPLKTCLIVPWETGELAHGTNGVMPGKQVGKAIAAAFSQSLELVRLKEPALTRG